MRALLRLALRNLRRRPLRTAASLLGVALAVFLYATIESLSRGLDSALAGDEATRTLIVYRKNRYCPQTSRLPEQYRDAIRSAPGVDAVLPLRVYLNNCRANLDLVVFEGTDARSLIDSGGIRVIEGSAEAFVADPAAALVGVGFARRRGLASGGAFRFGEIDVKVAGIFQATDRVKEDVVFTHLAYLQRAVDRGETGLVTQFEVRLAASADADAVAREIDDRLATREAPTETFSRSEFLARATAELADLIGFARMFGQACVIVLCVLLANSTLLAVHERTREHALLLALGYRGRHVATTLLVEASAVTLAGASLGALLSLVAARTLHLTIGIEGIPIALDPSLAVFFRATSIALAAALGAALLPAFLAARMEVAPALRSA